MPENHDNKFLDILVFWINEDRLQEYKKLIHKSKNRAATEDEIQRFQETLISNRNDIKKEAADLFDEFIKSVQSKGNVWWKNHVLIETGYTAPTILSLICFCFLLYKDQAPSSIISGWAHHGLFFTSIISIVLTVGFTVLKIYNRTTKG